MKLKKIIIKELYKKFEKNKSKEIDIKFLNILVDFTPYFFIRYSEEPDSYFFVNTKGIFLKLKEIKLGIFETKVTNVFKPSFYITLTLVNYFLFFVSPIKEEIKEKLKTFEFSDPKQLEISYLRKKDSKYYYFYCFKNLYYPFICFIAFKSLEYKP